MIPFLATIALDHFFAIVGTSTMTIYPSPHIFLFHDRKWLNLVLFKTFKKVCLHLCLLICVMYAMAYSPQSKVPVCFVTHASRMENEGLSTLLKECVYHC